MGLFPKCVLWCACAFALSSGQVSSKEPQAAVVAPCLGGAVCRPGDAVCHGEATPTTAQKCKLNGVPGICCHGTRRARQARPAEDYDYADYGVGAGAASTCAAIAAGNVPAASARKAWNKCIEYQEKYVYPCDFATGSSLTKSRLNNCHHNTDPLVIGGEDAAVGEFPHMVMLAFGDQQPTAESWGCAGTILNEKFILTAAHCTSNRERQDVSWAAIHVLRRNDTLSTWSLYRITQRIPHPNYAGPVKYHDIALLQTDRPMYLNGNAVPACLDTGRGVKLNRVQATGWGYTEYRGREGANTLQKVVLDQFGASECARSYPPSPRYLPRGFDNRTMLCYGSRDAVKDTCQGDSGGPLVVSNTEFGCMYTVVGVSSYGKGCGLKGVPAVYTRVAHYLDWIEKTIWP